MRRSRSVDRIYTGLAELTRETANGMPDVTLVMLCDVHKLKREHT